MDDDAMVEDEVIYPEILAEFPGLLFDRGMSDDVVEVEPELSDAQLALAAAVNADIVEINTTGVPSLIDEEVIIDDVDNDDEHCPLLLDSARFTGVSPAEDASIAMGVEPEAVTVQEGADGEEDDDISVEELSALLPTVRIRKPVQRMNIAATNTKTYDDNMNVIHINIHDDVPRQLSEDEQVLHVLGVVMAQIYSIKNGIKEFGERGSESVMKELRSIDDLDTFFPVAANSLTKEQKQAALESLPFITEKRNGDVKTQTCVNGSKQRLDEGYDKNACMMVTCAIDAHEERDVATIDLPQAFLNTNY